LKYLKEILLSKKKEIKEINKNFQSIKHTTVDNGEKKGRFARNIKRDRVNIIAEIKKASPSRGILNSKLDVGKTALLYDRFKGFISGVSVLTESLYFNGNIENIEAVKRKTTLPVLRKDFIFNEAQVYQSAEIGSDCILLISSILSARKLKKLYNLASNLGLDVLVEVHTMEELDKALNIGAKIIGINNRNLKNMIVDEKVIYNFLDYLNNYPGIKDISDKIFVCESGVKDVKYIKDLFLSGISTFLIGEYFMKSSNLEETLSNMELELRKANLI